MKLTSYLHLVQRLRINGAVPPFTHAPSCRTQGQLSHYYIIFFQSLNLKYACVSQHKASFSMHCLCRCTLHTGQHTGCTCGPLLMLAAFYNVLHQDVNSTE